MPVVWRKQLSTGNDLIDLDHKYLLALFNSIELSLSQVGLLSYLPIFFGQLVEYAKEHFAREEKIQLKIQYPGYLDHKRQHLALAAQLETLQEQVDAALSNEDPLSPDLARLPGAPRETPEALRARLERDVLALAREWVIEHVVKSDKDMKPYLRHYPANFS